MICCPWLSPARVLDHGAKRGSSLRHFAATRDLADKGFALSGVLAAGRLRSEQRRMLQRQWLTYRPGVRPTVAATMNPNALPHVSLAPASVGARRIGRPSGRPIWQTKQCRCPHPSGQDF